MPSFKRDPHNHVVFALKGGLGNQLFQFSCAVSYSARYGRCFSLNLVQGNWNFALTNWKVKHSVCYRAEICEGELVLRRGDCKAQEFPSFKFSEYLESAFDFRELPNVSHTYFDGYWQSAKYFESIVEPLKVYLKKGLAIKDSIDERTVVVHVRLGDMATDKQAREFHGIQDESYFLRGIDSFHSARRTICIVTQDSNQVASFYPRLYAIASVFQSSDRITDLSFLASARCLVISHSTFSWWGAFLSGGQVVAPKMWFSPKVMSQTSTTDLFPSEWKVL